MPFPSTFFCMLLVGSLGPSHKLGVVYCAACCLISVTAVFQVLPIVCKYAAWVCKNQPTNKKNLPPRRCGLIPLSVGAYLVETVFLAVGFFPVQEGAHAPEAWGEGCRQVQPPCFCQESGSSAKCAGVADLVLKELLNELCFVMACVWCGACRFVCLLNPCLDRGGGFGVWWRDVLLALCCVRQGLLAVKHNALQSSRPVTSSLHSQRPERHTLWFDTTRRCRCHQHTCSHAHTHAMNGQPAAASSHHRRRCCTVADF